MLYKYVVRNTALAAGKSATFMPKPIFGDNGSGMHTHQSLWKEGTPLFADKSGPAGLSQLARSYVGRTARPCARAARVLRADDELVPPARAGLRGAGEPRVLVAQPVGVHPDPDVQRVAEGEAARVPLPRRDSRTRTSRSRRCSWPAWTGSSRASTRASPPTSTCSRRSTTSRRCRARSTSRSTRSRPTTSSSRRAACSARS